MKNRNSRLLPGDAQIQSGRNAPPQTIMAQRAEPGYPVCIQNIHIMLFI